MNRSQIENLITDLSEHWNLKLGNDVLRLYLIGGSAVQVQFDGRLQATKDLDIVIDHGQQQILETVFADYQNGGQRAQRIGLYLDLVLDAFPPMPIGFRDNAVEVQVEKGKATRVVIGLKLEG